ncbi:MAG: hypothetical protein BMS9Abin29_1251 [Gemmatimonadota bacterium]|nr:MAG: hypothetical protein BMS9Abin29_1251 [Gemmatimonadota bacterium]
MFDSRRSQQSRTTWLRALGVAWSAAFLATAGAAAQDGMPSHYAIENARLVRLTGRTIESGTIVVRDGIITAIGDDVQTPPGAWVIDGTGLTVYPGLIDGLSTLGMSAEDAPPPREGGRFGGGPPGGRGGGVDATRPSQGPEDRPATFAWLNAADRLELDDDDFGRWRAAGFTSALTAPSNGFFSGNAAIINLAGERPSDLVVTTAVAQRLNLNGGPGHRGFPSSQPGVFAYIKQFFGDAEHYRNANRVYNADPNGRERPTYDRALEGIMPVLGGPEPLLFPASTTTEIRRAMRISERIGATPIIYGAQSAYRMVDELSSSRLLVSLDWPEAPKDGDPEADTSLDVLRHRLLAPTAPARLHESGVRFAFYSDGLGPKEVIGAARKAVEAGLPHDDAVEALSLGVARIFGVDDRLGALQEGFIANLVVTDGDLLAEDTEVKMVFVDGRRFEIEEGDDDGPGAGRRGDAGPRARPDGARAAEDEEADTDPAEEEEAGPTDAELRALIGPSYRGPYRDDRVTVIQNATILTVTGGTIENGSILIRDGKIADVGTDVSVPRGAYVIDATDEYVMPGIIDAHTHIAGGFNEGSVQVSSMTGVKDNLNPDDINIYRALAGGVTTVNILHGSSNPIGGQNALIKLRWGSKAEDLLLEGAPESIKFALGENPKRGNTFPATRMGVMDIIRQAFLDAQRYQAEWDDYNANGDDDDIPPRMDLEMEALAEILSGERLVHAHSYRQDEILQLIRLAEEFGFRIATFQHVLEGYKVAKEIAEHGAGASTFSDWWAYKMEAYDAIPYNAAIMTEKGVTVSINSDSNEEMRHLNEEAAKTMKWGGLSETQALSLITINPARQLGVEGSVGSIEVGKDADLVIYDRHPLDNFAVPQQTFVDGKLYFDIDADRERQRAIDAEKEALQGKAQRRIATDDQGDEEVDR